MQRRRFLMSSGGLLAGTALGLSSPARAKGLTQAEYAANDALGLAELMRGGAVSPLEVLEAAVSEAINPVINAVVLKHYDLARAALAQGKPSGPFGGVPMLLKDLGISFKNTITSNGSVFFRDAVADHDSTLVDRYRRAGLNIFGKTASPEFGQTATTESRLWGMTRNPWSREHSAGGSSGGSSTKPMRTRSSKWLVAAPAFSARLSTSLSGRRPSIRNRMVRWRCPRPPVRRRISS